MTSAIRRMKRKAASDHADLDRDGEVDEHRERERREQDETSLFGACSSARKVRHSLMWYATTTRIAASVAIGMSAAHRPKKSVISSSVTACVMPATGVRPPFFTFVAVRAIAPVAGMPPNSGVTMFATPCATSSMLERCRPPIMPSATTAESSDSTAPSSAIVNAGADERGDLRERRRAAPRDAGSAALIPPNRLPMVSTGRLEQLRRPRSRRSARRTARESGGSPCGQVMMIASVSARQPDRVRVVRSEVRCEQRRHFSKKSAGTAPMRSPRRSLTWLEKMMTAMPLVKPMTTGCGMNLIDRAQLRRRR